jgi:hypothetical protein
VESIIKEPVDFAQTLRTKIGAVSERLKPFTDPLGRRTRISGNVGHSRQHTRLSLGAHADSNAQRPRSARQDRRASARTDCGLSHERMYGLGIFWGARSWSGLHGHCDLDRHSVAVGDRDPGHIAGRQIATVVVLPCNHWRRRPDACAVGDNDSVHAARRGCDAREGAVGPGCQVISELAAGRRLSCPGRQAAGVGLVHALHAVVGSPVQFTHVDLTWVPSPSPTCSANRGERARISGE